MTVTALVTVTVTDRPRTKLLRNLEFGNVHRKTSHDHGPERGHGNGNGSRFTVHVCVVDHH